MDKKFSALIMGATLIMATSNVFGMIQGVVGTGGAVAYSPEQQEIHRLKAGEVVTIEEIDANSDLYSIIGMENRYFVAKDYIAIDKVKIELVDDDIKVRSKAHQDGKLLQSLHAGQEVTVVAQGDKWYEVQLSDGNKGYIYKTQISNATTHKAQLEQLPYKNFNPVEVLSWNEAKYVIPRGAVFTIEDVYTGKTFEVKRTFGTNHADVEALTKADTAKIKAIWGGFTWERRPVIVHMNGRKLAASLAGMPHAGGSLNAIRGNGMSGVIDLHFKGSKRHAEGSIKAVVDPQHQKAIEVAAKYQK